MSLTIRERCQTVTDCLFEQGVKGIAKIAAATGLSKSSVHRHQQAIAHRNQHPESLWWETKTGSHSSRFFSNALLDSSFVKTDHRLSASLDLRELVLDVICGDRPSNAARSCNQA